MTYSSPTTATSSAIIASEVGGESPDAIWVAEDVADTLLLRIHAVHERVRAVE